MASALGLIRFLKQFPIKDLAIGGNRRINGKTKKKIEYVTNKALINGCRIVTGGAEGTDHIVMKAYLKYPLPKSSLKVFLPSDIQKHYRHYAKLEGAKKAKALLKTLLDLKKDYPESIYEPKFHPGSYRKAANLRNSLIIDSSDAFIFFKPAGSKGTINALKKVKERNLPYIVFD